MKNEREAQMEAEKSRKYLAHIDGDREQLLKDHLTGTAELAALFAKSFGKEEWGYCEGLLHDIGKYSQEFLQKITQNLNRKVDHSTAGAKVCAEMGGFYLLLRYCIAGHHAGLPNTGGSGVDPSTLRGRLKKIVPNYEDYKKEIEIPPLKEVPFDPRETTNADFSCSVFIRMLYSCLVDADFLDTESFMKQGKTERDAGEPLEILYQRLYTYVEKWLENTDLETVNGRRSEILRNCIASADKERGLFRLTVPTGGGKTLASLAFALKHAIEHGMERVIYVVPYTSIIEQNAEVFREILGDRNVLENHYNVDYEASEELKPMQLAAENWDKPVIVTTNVQFFESLFSNKSSKCRKLHRIANSVVIFDEAQMLPMNYLTPCLAMMEELMLFYRSSLVLCTATQPALDGLFREKWDVRELCPRKEEQFRFFKRTNFEMVGKICEEELVERLAQEKQALCIVNLKGRAQSLYQKLKENGVENVYHLSTSMYPKHRKIVLAKVRENLSWRGENDKENRKPCILIATSLVEAGVDLDFQTVYRQMAGIDSMIQAAGRCNREGKRAAEESKVYIFSLAEKEYMPGQTMQMDVARALMGEKKNLSQPETVEEYFERMYYLRRNELDQKKIMDEFKKGIYNFDTVAKKFKLIDTNTVTILIPKEEEAKELLSEVRYKGYTKSLMRKVGQYSVNVYENTFEKLYGAGMVRTVSEDIQDLYELCSEDAYLEECGLRLDVESGMGVFIE